MKAVGQEQTLALASVGHFVCLCAGTPNFSSIVHALKALIGNDTITDSNAATDTTASSSRNTVH